MMEIILPTDFDSGTEHLWQHAT